MKSPLSKLKVFLLTGASPFWRGVLRIRGIHCGMGVTLIGRPGINRKRGSSIRLGEGVILCSNGMANPVSEGGRCRPATLVPNAELILHDKVGISSSIICCAQRIEIGEGTLIGGGCLIMDTDFHPRDPDGNWLTDPLAVSKPVFIGKNASSEPERSFSKESPLATEQ